jgi:hypothetical protein
MERLFTMHPINKHRLVCKAPATIAFILLVVWCALGSTATASDRDIWKNYTPEQKQLAIAGFTDCYRSVSANKEAFTKTDMVTAVRLVDEASSGAGEASFGSLILQSVKKAPVAKPDAHAEHWEGPTGFHTGLWWRGIEDPERQAYLQGVFWCTEVSNGIATVASQESVQQAVAKLNDWYVISDDGWKDPRSNARVDASAISALQRVEILRIKKVTTKQ